MVGITGIDIALRTSHMGTTRTGLVAMRTSAIMSHMAKTISQATGFGDGSNANDDPGILFTNDPTDELNPLSLKTSPMCIRYDRNPNPTPDLGDDSWVCYNIDSATGNVLFCNSPTPGAAVNCPAGSEILDRVVDIHINHLRDPSVPKFAVRVMIDNRFNPAQPYNTNSNPSYALTTEIETPMHSF